MDKKVISGIVLLVVLSYAGIAAAHSYGGYSQEVEFRDHYKGMLDLHKQYFNNQITFDELYQQMGAEMRDSMPGETGYACVGSGFHMMNMMGW